MSSHSEKLLELELELRSLRGLRDEVENLRGTLESVRTRLSTLEQGGRGGSGSTHTLGQNPHTQRSGGGRTPATDGRVVVFAASLEAQMNRHDDMLSVHDIRLADMDLRFQVLETASYNGTLIWKIRDYKRRKQEAVAAKTLSLYSQPFYTGYFGYKMCARIYLNGDGMGKGTHLSLFFVVMRGEYDALLPWPFKQKVGTARRLALRSHQVSAMICDFEETVCPPCRHPSWTMCPLLCCLGIKTVLHLLKRLKKVKKRSFQTSNIC